MKLFLGVDGGQSSTTALIADEHGTVLGRGNDGPCNHVQSAAEGRAKFERVIGGCIRQAARQAGLTDDNPPFAAACLGFSGGPADKVAILREMLQVAELNVTTDAAIALAGAMGGGPGIITIAGTGNISFGRNAAGRLVRAGGWGYIFGDEGGGFDLTRRAVRAALKQHEGWGPRTALHDLLLAATGAADANQMMHWFYTAEWPRNRIAALSTLVDQAADAGDPEALRILHEGAAELAVITFAVRDQLFQSDDPVRLAPIGSVWQSRTLKAAFAQLLAANSRHLFGPPQYGPAAGALLEAYRLTGLQPTLNNVPETVK